MALVYSTDSGKLCKQCGQAAHKGACQKNDAPIGDGKVRISRETKGRKGAGVTLIKGVPLNESDAKLLLKQLQKACGVGGSLKNGVIELQGDQREKVQKALADKGWDVKISGG